MTEKIKYNNLIICAAAASLMMFAIYIFMGFFPFGKVSVITGDLNGQYIPFYSFYKQILDGCGQSLSYTLQKGMGGSAYSLFAYYLSSPFLLLLKFVSLENLAVFANILLFIKIVLASVAFTAFADYKFKENGYFNVIFGLCYGFMSYNFAYSQNIIWLDIIILAPIMLLLTERLAQGKGSVLFSFTLALSIFANFYITFMLCIFIAVYFLYILFLQKLAIKEKLLACVRFFFACLAGGGLLMAFFLPVLLEIATGKGVSADLPGIGTNFLWHDFFRQFIFNVFKWQDVENGFPLVFSSGIIIILLAVFLAHNNICLKEKLAGAFFIVFLFLSMYITPLNIFWHGFKSPIWFLYRQSFLFILFTIILGARAVYAGKMSKLSIAFCLGLIASFCLVLVVYYTGEQGIIKLCIFFAFIFLLYILYLAYTFPPFKKALLALIAVMVIAEIYISNINILKQFEQYTVDDYSAFVSEYAEAVEKINSLEQGEIFRMEKDSFRTLNDPMLLGYNGLSHFSSTEETSLRTAYEKLGYINSGVYTPNTLFADSLIGLKYLLAKNAPTVHFKYADSADKLSVYKNSSAFPLAFLCEKVVQKTLADNPIEYQNKIAQKVLNLEKPLFTPVLQFSLYDETNNLFSDKGIVPSKANFVFTAEKDGAYYALINKVLDIPVTVVANGLSQPENSIINLGNYKKGDKIPLYIEGISTPYQMNTPSVYCMDTQLFYANTPVFCEQMVFTNGELSFNITSDKPSNVLITLPYDKSITAQVNGENIKVQNSFDGLCSLAIKAGENNIVLSYRLKGGQLGIAFTIVAILILIITVYFEYKRKR